MFRATDLRLGKVWAVKSLKKHCAQGIHEADIMKRLDFPTLPNIVDLIMEGDQVYLVMDYLEGRSMGELLRKGYRFSEDEVIKIGCELAGTLRYLHGRTLPILYRDLKPDNLMRSAEGQLKLVDFGISSYLGGDSINRGNAGTRGYAAPEQYGGVCDERTDIYGLGMTLKVLSAGKGSWGLKRLIRKCTHSAKKHRFSGAEEVEKRLLMLLEERRQNRSLGKWLLGAMGVLLAAGGIFMVVTEAENFRYNRFLSQATCTDEVEKQIVYYRKAIDLCPEREWAYLQLLRACTEGGRTREGAELIEQKLSFDAGQRASMREVTGKLAILYFCGNPLDEKFPVDYKKASQFMDLLADEDSLATEQSWWKETSEIAGELGKFGSEVNWSLVCDVLDSIQKYAIQLQANGEPQSGYQMLVICGSVYITNAAYLREVVEKPYCEGISLYEEARMACRRAALGEACERDVDERLSAACYLSGILEETGEEKNKMMQKSIDFGCSLYGIGILPTLEKNVRLREAAARKQMGDVNGAFGCYDKYLELYPDDLRGICAYVSLLLEEQRTDEAVALMREAKEIPGAEEDRNYRILHERLEESYEI